MRTGIVLEDHPGARKWLLEALEEAIPGIQATAWPDLGSARARLSLLTASGNPPDIALVDLSLPDGNGIDFLRDLREQHSHCISIVVTIHDDHRHVLPALRAGAEGYLLKQQERHELVDRLKRILDGEPPLSPSIARKVLETFYQAPVSETDSSALLTSREREVLQLLAKGLTLIDVARMLEITRHTVAGYVKNIYRKLEVSSRAEATLEAIRMGLIDP
jgi:DNA-binding NarL/FixJ family response regulator